MDMKSVNNDNTLKSFSALVNNLDEIIFQTDGAGHLTFLNPAWENILGYQVNDSLGKALADFIITDSVPIFMTQVNSLKNASRNHFNMECQLKRKDDNVTWVNMYVSAIKNSHDELTGMTGRIMDATRLRFYLDEIYHQHNFYETIINNGSSDIAVFNKDYQYIYINKKAVTDDKLRQWLIGKDDFDYCHYRNKPVECAIARRNYMKQAIASHQPVMFEEKLGKDDKDIYYLRTHNPLYNEDGSVKYVIGYGTDITEYKESQFYTQKFREAIRNATDGIAMTYESGEFYYTNPVFAGYFGYTNTDDMTGKKWYDMFDADIIAKLRDEVIASLMENDRWSGIAAATTRSGIQVHLEISISRLPNKELIYICRDITQKIHQQRELEKLALVASKTNGIVVIADSRGHIEWINDGVKRIFKYSLEEVVGHPLILTMSGDGTDQQTLHMIKEAVTMGEPLNGEVLLYAKDKTPVWLLYDITPIKDEHGNVINYVGVHADITMVKQAEQVVKDTLEEEKKLSELKSRFTSLASHEFRTPLTGIQLSAGIINAIAEKKDATMFDSVSKSAKKISEQVDTITAIMDNIFIMGRMEAGRVYYKPKKGFLDTFVKNTIKKELSKENRIYKNISVIKLGQRTSTTFDHTLMNHIIKNLVSNAIKYSAGKPYPEVIITYTADEVIIEVKDHGIGIPATESKDVFQSFFRASNVDNTPGTGLGLVLVKQFVNMHGGNISFKSELNKGTSFFVHLPLTIH